MASDYDLSAAFKAVEDELTASMIRNLKHHRAEETKEGYEWTMWQVEQLKALEKYKKENQEKYKTQFENINAQIEAMIYAAKEQGGTDQEQKILRAMKKGFAAHKASRGATAEFFKLNKRKLESLVKATVDDMKRAETAVLRMANDQYRKIIYNAQVYANTGAGTYEKAVDMATKDFLKSGINCIEYENGSRHTIADYADMAIRTAGKRAYLQGEGEKRKEWGISTVIVNKRGNPCPKCLPHCGKVYIDDVWSDGPKSGISPLTGIKYPLLSSAVAGGLYHPRCKDSHTTYFEGISTPPEGSVYTRDELDQIVDQYKADQRQQYAERQAEKFERMRKYSIDSDNKKKYGVRKTEWEKLANSSFVKMSNKSNMTTWPPRKPKITADKYKELMDYGRQNNIELSGFKQFDGDIEVVKEIIRDANEVANDFPMIKDGKRHLTVELNVLMGPKDFAITSGHIVQLNADALRDVSLLSEEYAKLERCGWFAKGTDYHSIIKHEIGHVVANLYKINGLEIAKSITGIKSTAELMIYLSKNLSSYAGAFEDGSEIISECFASVYGGEKNEFALRVLEECDKIISRKR